MVIGAVWDEQDPRETQASQALLDRWENLGGQDQRVLVVLQVNLEYQVSLEKMAYQATQVKEDLQESQDHKVCLVHLVWQDHQDLLESQDPLENLVYPVRQVCLVSQVDLENPVKKGHQVQQVHKDDLACLAHLVYQDSQEREAYLDFRVCQD